jgi:hypothetical protein
LTACTETMRWLNSALVNSMWLTVVIQSENYQHHHHQYLFFMVICENEDLANVLNANFVFLGFI